MVFENTYKIFQELMQSIAYTLFNRIILSIIILLFGFIIGRVVGKLVMRVLHEFELDKTLKNIARLTFSAENLISSLASFLIYFFAVILTLKQLGVDTLVFNVIAVGILAIVTVSAILAIKDFVPNAFAGLSILRRRLFKKGDKIRIKGVTGIITDINLTDIKIQTVKGDVIFMPNSLFLKEEVVKFKE